MDKNNLQIAIRLAMESLELNNIAQPTEEQVNSVNTLANQIIDGTADQNVLDLYKKELEQGATSPYVDRFDYNAHMDSTIPQAIVDVLNILSNEAEALKPVYTKPIANSKEDNDLKKLVQESDEKVFLAIHKSLNDNNVPIAYYDRVFEYLKSIIVRFENKVADTLVTEKDMLLSVLIGSKHPEYGNYDVSFATEQQVNDATKKLLEEKGIKREEYFGN